MYMYMYTYMVVCQFSIFVNMTVTHDWFLEFIMSIDCLSVIIQTPIYLYGRSMSVVEYLSEIFHCDQTTQGV